MKVFFEDHKHELLRIIEKQEFEDDLMKWIENIHSEGLTKNEIYKLFLELHKFIQTCSITSSNETLYDELSDFMDGFTAWGKNKKILPDEPDV